MHILHVLYKLLFFSYQSASGNPTLFQMNSTASALKQYFCIYLILFVQLIFV